MKYLCDLLSVLQILASDSDDAEMGEDHHSVFKEGLMLLFYVH